MPAHSPPTRAIARVGSACAESIALCALHRLEPPLTPVRVHPAGAEPLSRGALALAHGPLQDQAILPDVEHPTRLLVDDALDSVDDSHRPTAVGEFLTVE